MTVRDFIVLIPCKGLAEGKSRLSSVLSETDRYQLCAALLRRTLDVVLQVAHPDNVLLTTADLAAAMIASKKGISVIPDSSNDLNQALLSARRGIVPRQGRRQNLLIVPTDLPLVDTAALRRPLSEDADIVIASDRAKLGTNLLYLSGNAAEEFTFSFGHRSFLRHCDLALRGNFALRVIEDAALAFDLDEPADLAELCDSGRQQTFAQLAPTRSGL